MKRTLSFAALVCLFLIGVTPSFATNGTQLIGIGSTQKGMGGAVVAAPEDAMTAISNPAGMAVIGSRADFNGEAFMPRRSVDFASLGGGDTDGGSRLYGVPSLGWTAPAFMRDDVYFGGGFFGMAGMGVDYDVISAGPLGDADIYTQFQFAKIAPAIAWNVNDRLTLGTSLNFDYQLLEIRQLFGAVGLGLPFGDGVNLDLGRSVQAYGGGITLGGIYRLNDKITLGATYISKQWFQDLKYRVGDGAIVNFPDGVFLGANTGPGTYRLDLDFPQQAAIGFAYHPNTALTLEVDVKWINWEDTYDSAKLKGDFSLLNTTNGQPSTASSINLNFGWDDQVVVAVGARYAVNEDLTLRIGYNWAESPIDDEDVFNNIAFPAIVEQHVTLGASYNLGPHWALSGSLMWAFKEDMTGKKDIPEAFQAGFGTSSGVEIELEEYSVGTQITYRF